MYLWAEGTHVHTSSNNSLMQIFSINSTIVNGLVRMKAYNKLILGYPLVKKVVCSYGFFLFLWSHKALIIGCPIKEREVRFYLHCSKTSDFNMQSRLTYEEKSIGINMWVEISHHLKIKHTIPFIHKKDL